MPHGKICYLEIPAKTAQASSDEFGLYEERHR